MGRSDGKDERRMSPDAALFFFLSDDEKQEERSRRFAGEKDRGSTAGLPLPDPWALDAEPKDHNR